MVLCEIYEEGNVYPCNDAVCDELIMGNVKCEDILSIWKKMSWHIFRGGWSTSDLSKCNSCFARGYCCMKGCRAYALTTTGNYYGNFRECGMVKRQFEQLLDFNNERRQT